ncbi:hypothetical protein FO519_001006 [Halicephalobus sp. NKZ332]|nr:hypothetical protein FO519_001006 [Halicephalobus sp. NKZ332]
MLKVVFLLTVILVNSLAQYNMECQQESSLYRNGQWTNPYGGTTVVSCLYNDFCVAGEFYFKQGSDVTQIRIKSCASNVQNKVREYTGQSVNMHCNNQDPIEQLAGNFRYAYQCCSDYRQQQCSVPNVNLGNGTPELKSVFALLGISIGFLFLFH